MMPENFFKRPGRKYKWKKKKANPCSNMGYYNDYFSVLFQVYCSLDSKLSLPEGPVKDIG
jgi:hypothetical protein